MTVLFAGSLPPADTQAWCDALQQALPEERFVFERSAQADAAIDVAVVANPRPGALAGLAGLRLVQSLWAGVERVLADDTLPRDVPLARMVDPSMAHAMVQTALWAVLALHRGFPTYAVQQAQGVWLQHPQRRADEVEVLVLGMGEMGAAVARSLRDLGYRVTGWSRSAHTLEGVGVAAGDAGLAAALPQAEVVINLLPLTPFTRGLIDAGFLARMRRGASLVNLGRGPHVVDDDLLAALDARHLQRAVLDVYAVEPLPEAHRFWTHPRVTMLPHVGAATDPRSASRIVADNVRALRAGRPVAHLVERGRGY